MGAQGTINITNQLREGGQSPSNLKINKLYILSCDVNVTTN